MANVTRDREDDVDPNDPWDCGVPPHPQADKFIAPKWDEPGQCVCGVQLPPLKDWHDAVNPWAWVICSTCERGYVDEEEFVAIYDDGFKDD